MWMLGLFGKSLRFGVEVYRTSYYINICWYFMLCCMLLLVDFIDPLALFLFKPHLRILVEWFDDEITFLLLTF